MTSKLIFDPIHGLLEFDDICLKIIDTMEFQRLRNIKQLGLVSYVFPGANHTRFEHSLGVCYLAGELLINISERQPELEITQEDICNIKLAGLCHDLGHGPFSHTFDELVEKSDSPYRYHEKRSCLILEYIVCNYQINITPLNLKRIQDLIYPNGNNELNKKFMYQIVANNTNGIDVDKFDYLKRDTYYLGLKYNCDYSRIFKYARVIDQEICYPKKLIFDICEIFYTRVRLHKQVYNHPVCKAIEYMVKQVFIHADSILKFNEFIDNVVDFCKLNDGILYFISMLDLSKESKELIYRINSRDLYKYIGELQEVNIENLTLEERHAIIINKLQLGIPSDLLTNVKFYNNKQDTKYFKLDMNSISHLFLKFGTETVYRIYITKKKDFEKGREIMDKLSK